MANLEPNRVGVVAPGSTLTDADVVRRMQAGEIALFEILMRRHNQRLYRAVRAVVKDENDVEDVMQQAYINACLRTSETGEGLGLGEEAVKTRLHRARAMIRRAVTVRLGDAAAGAFQFHAPRCDRVGAAVFGTINHL